ncbi:hypothetical protein AAVH_25257 [Aphelenchoides avenae]|nr:hypothetical protein AAVH_25257 [Aphelenchus avenae]
MSDAENAVLPESRKRRAYSREEKLEIVKYAKDNNAVLAARQYGVDRTIIGRWCKAENSLKEQREGSRRRDRGGRGRKDEEEEEVANESDHNHAEGFEVSVHSENWKPIP